MSPRTKQVPFPSLGCSADRWGQQALNEVLALRFNNDDALQGYVRGGNFVLWSERTRSVIDLNKRWESCFGPGDVVDMSIALQPNKRCLVCGSKVSLEANKRVAWYVFLFQMKISSDNGM